MLVKYNRALLKMALRFNQYGGPNPKQVLSQYVQSIQLNTPDWFDEVVVDQENFPFDFEAEIREDGTFLGPDGNIWKKNVLGFGHSADVYRVTLISNNGGVVMHSEVAAEMFCGHEISFATGKELEELIFLIPESVLTQLLRKEDLSDPYLTQEEA